MAKIRDMTKGSPAKLIFTFALPLMLGNIFQQLYTVVDTAIVGQFVGVEALASVGAADWPNWMVLGIVTGFAQGFCILISQRFGAGDGEGLRRAVSHTYALGLAMGALITLAAHLLAGPILVMLGTPDNVIGGSLTYLRISYSGILVVMA
ncbi:MAG: MATE family efflux transporter, partial [Candidatus Spyradocola sp.]